MDQLSHPSLQDPQRGDPQRGAPPRDSEGGPRGGDPPMDQRDHVSEDQDSDELVESLEELMRKPALDENDYVMEAWQERVNRENRRAQRTRDEIMRRHLLAIVDDLERILSQTVSKDLEHILDRVKSMLVLVEPLDPLSPVEEDYSFFFVS